MKLVFFDVCWSSFDVFFPAPWASVGYDAVHAFAPAHKRTIPANLSSTVARTCCRSMFSEFKAELCV